VYKFRVSYELLLADLKSIAKADVEEVQVPGRTRVDIEGHCHDFVTVTKPCAPSTTILERQSEGLCT
jgi:hypothetical protein